MNVKPHHRDNLEQRRHKSRQEREAKQHDRYRAVLSALDGHRTEWILHEN